MRNDKKNIKILVTGCNGMLGTDLMKVLTKEFSATGVDIDTFDIINWDDAFSFLQEKGPDIIVNAAAYTNVEGCEDRKEYAYNVNVVGVENLATASTLLGIKLVHLSSDYIFNGKKRTPYKEEDGPDPINTYGETKWLGDKAILETFWKNENDNFLIVRTSWLFGKKGADFVSKIVHKIDQGKKQIKVVDDQKGSPTYSRDLASALLELIKGNITGIINVANEGETTWFDFAEKIKEMLFPDKDIEIIPEKSTKLPLKAKRPACSVLDTQKLEFVLGEKMRPWQDALKAYLKQFHKDK